jgi:predicted amidohydrolase
MTSDTGLTSVAPLRVALGEYDIGWEDPATSLSRAEGVVSRAAGAGARLVMLPEMCVTGFTMDSKRHATPLDGPHVGRLRAMAAASKVWVLAGVATRERTGGVGGAGEAAGEAATRERFFNAAVLFDPSGEIVHVYHKQRLFAMGAEHASYEPGRSVSVVTIEGVRVSPFICYDLRFPEIFRAAAPGVDAMLLIANWPVARRAHWDVLVRARAIENLCYMVAVNRTGDGGGATYDGGSAAYGPFGEALPVAPASPNGAPAIVDINPACVARVRAEYPFLRDR